MSTSPRPADAMVATSHPIAADIALEVLRSGGTAVDAAVAASAALCVVDPRSTGLGGDMFALVWPAGESEPVGLEAAGTAPAGMTVKALRDASHTSMPVDGPWSVTVPGSVAGWAELIEKFGNRGLDDLLAPASDVARNGFEVLPTIAEEWATASAKLKKRPAASVFLKDGRTPRAGETMHNPDLASTLDAIASDGYRSFYEGDIANAIATAVSDEGGPLTSRDLNEWAGPTWVKPVCVDYHGAQIYEMPPPGQGLVVLQAMGILAELEEPLARSTHGAIEAMKLAVTSGSDHIADPLYANVPTEHLLSKEYLATLASGIHPNKAGTGSMPTSSDTIYVTVVDESGTACSLIQSVYQSFGSGIVVPGTGMALQNRGANFVLDDTHVNRPEPGKRPYHTIIPSMVGRGGEFFGCLGVVGGFMQPQGQVQILKEIIDNNRDPQSAIDAPRWRWVNDRTIGVENGFPKALAADLAGKGHVVSELKKADAGGAQAIIRNATGLQGGSDRRKDGLVRFL